LLRLVAEFAVVCQSSGDRSSTLRVLQQAGLFVMASLLVTRKIGMMDHLVACNLDWQIVVKKLLPMLCF
jgi:hypothetical protein